VVPETKRQSVEWKHPTSLAKKKFKTQSLPEKSDDSFWDSKGPIMEHCTERSTTVNSVRYSKVLHVEFFFLSEGIQKLVSWIKGVEKKRDYVCGK
jgi:hypothetical protein